MQSRSVLIVLFGLLFAACSSVLPKAPPMSGNPGPYDGDYGVSLAYDHPSGTCLGSRIETKFWVRNGDLGGYANHPIVGTFIIDGKVLPDGQLENVTAAGPRDVKFQGTIERGTWSTGDGSDCKGQFITARQGAGGAPVRPAAVAPKPAPGSAEAASSVPIAISWQGIADVLLGELNITEAGDGGTIEVRGSRILCHGQWKRAPRTDGGSWTVSCSNGKVASGTFSYEGQRQGTGRGVDTALNEVKVTFGRR